MPQLLLYDKYTSGLSVVFTHPRQNAVRTFARLVADEMGVVLGEGVGYKIQSAQIINKNGKTTRLIYMTEDVLLEQLYDSHLHMPSELSASRRYGQTMLCAPAVRSPNAFKRLQYLHAGALPHSIPKIHWRQRHRH